MDSYHTPYKVRCCYWPGLLLVLCFILLLVFAINSQQDPSINFLAILVGTGALQLWVWTGGGVYKNGYLDATRRFICSEPDHPGWFHYVCQSLRRESACCWLHICRHSTCNIHWCACLSAGRYDRYHSMSQKDTQWQRNI